MKSIFDSESLPTEAHGFRSFEKAEIGRAHVWLRRWLLALFAALVALLFAPWTQNIRAKGKVTALAPEQRPQTIHATIAGRIERWHVREGELVRKGDTILQLSEVKAEYFDPDLIGRARAQAAAKAGAAGSYAAKADALDRQITATARELSFKKEQLANKIEQTRLKADGERAEIEAAKIDLRTEEAQLERAESLFQQGLATRTAIENKRLKLQQATAKMAVLESKLAQSAQEIDNLRAQLAGAESEYRSKIAKSESEKLSAISDRFAAEGDAQKLQSQAASYAERAKFYFITAPQDCYVNRAAAAGIGETVKEGQAVVHVLPARAELAVELFIDPIDLPLISAGAPVRFIFDGWPALVFSGWPGASVGSWAGRVAAIDNVANEKNKFRILVAPDPAAPAWPERLRPGGGATGIALLNDVPLGYEIWRQLNGFPPSFYESLSSEKKEEKAK